MQPSITWNQSRPLFADVSRWVRLHDAQAYAIACQAHCIGVKVAEGTGWGGTHDAQQTVERALAAGLIVVGYQYGPGGVQQFLEAFPPRPGCIPCLDFEFAYTQVTLADWAARVQLAERWVEAVEAAWDRAPWFYGRQQWIQAGQPEGTAVQRCPYWGPQYGLALKPPMGVGAPVAWQYTDGRQGIPQAPKTHAGIELGRDGLPKPCDMNCLLVGMTALRGMAGLLG